MGFWKRLTEFLFVGGGFNDQFRFTSDHSQVDTVDSLVNKFNPPSSIDAPCRNYEETFPTTGVTRKFYLVVGNHQIAPDGYLVDRMLFNGTYPGPTLEGDWGDEFEITVYNNLTNFNGTSVHWHGIRQLNTNWMDGVSGVTECPIPPGENATYRWKATQYGTSWYHNADGLLGAIKINGPTSMDYDYDLGPVLITDHFHKTAFSQVMLEYMGRPPAPDSFLMNGNGTYYCCPKTDKNCVGNSKLTSFNFEKGKKYKMSLVNTGVSTHMTFWIDKHNFSVVATDFVPIKPYNTSILNIAIGQRYDIIIEANATLHDTANSKRTNFWMHARDCNNGGARSNLGIIRYDEKNQKLPWTPPPDEKHICYGCLDELSTNLVPIVERNISLAANVNYQNDSFKVHLVGYPDDTAENSVLHKWVLKDSSFYLDWAEPSLSLVKVAYEKEWKHPRWPKGYEPVNLEYSNGSWVYFLIEGKFKESLHNMPGHKKIYKTQALVAHPMHIHGHDFVVLATGTKEFDPENPPKLNTINPPRRDVALLPVDGYLIIAFQMNNPGVWLMHCHIAWHASGGLALQFVESPREIGPAFQKSGVVANYSEQCNNWAAYYTMFNKNENATQEDSGI
ncbi:putative laccase precursor [Fusarium longipes]|uniref:Putative laccase n=1 Tax=Fusarium longipes TaxID=694270 RepID=A0A395SWG9_9HYPO|nr:putative laccase precursor [Fusarium longipes]